MEKLLLERLVRPAQVGQTEVVGALLTFECLLTL